MRQKEIEAIHEDIKQGKVLKVNRKNMTTVGVKGEEEPRYPFDMALERGDSNLSPSKVYKEDSLFSKEKIDKRMTEIYKDDNSKLTEE